MLEFERCERWTQSQDDSIFPRSLVWRAASTGRKGTGPRTDRKYGYPEEYNVDTQEETRNNGNNHQTHLQCPL
jgi:hypothetical protein